MKTSKISSRDFKTKMVDWIVNGAGVLWEIINREE